jgi:hypothetical protein
MNQDQIKAVLAQLLSIHQKIDAWLLANAAVTPADQEKAAELSAKQDTLIQQYDTATEKLLALVGKDLSGPATQLGALSDQIAATANDIGSVETVIGIADQALAAAASIVAIAA